MSTRIRGEIYILHPTLDNGRHSIVAVPRPGGVMEYQIRIEGDLGQGWAEWFDGAAISREGDGVTRVTCHVPDQAALHGLLRRLRDLGLPLLSITGIEDNPEGTPDGRST